MGSRRKYSREYKIEAVRLANSSGVTLKQIGQELGINANMLSKWRREFQKEGGQTAFPSKGNPRDEEVAALKRELTRVKKERDFLKQAATFFARESK